MPYQIVERAQRAIVGRPVQNHEWLDRSADSAPPERDPAHHAAMQLASRSLAESLRLPDRVTDA